MLQTDSKLTATDCPPTGQVLVVALDDGIVERARALSVGGVWRPGSDAHTSATQAKYLYAAAVVGTGTHVFVADLRTRLKADPFGYVYGDADIEAPGMSGGQMMVASIPVAHI